METERKRQWRRSKLEIQIQWGMLQRTVLPIKSECYNEHRCYNERGGVLSADVARACA